MSYPESPALTLAFLAAPGHTGQAITSETKEGARPMQATTTKHSKPVPICGLDMPVFLRKEVLYRTKGGEAVTADVLLTTSRAWRRYPAAFRGRYGSAWSLGGAFVLALSLDG
jgi:hypothetical protein